MDGGLVRRVGEVVVDWPSTLWGLLSPDLRGTMPCRAVSGGTAHDFTAALFCVPEDFFLGWGCYAVKCSLYIRHAGDGPEAKKQLLGRT
jgi:hypothetical protein